MPRMNQLCPQCGRMRRWHTNGLERCDTPAEIVDALRTYRDQNGSRWKAKLSDAWMRGDDLGQSLQLARNVIGPRRLYKLRLDR